MRRTSKGKTGGRKNGEKKRRNKMRGEGGTAHWALESGRWIQISALYFPSPTFHLNLEPLPNCIEGEQQ